MDICYVSGDATSPDGTGPKVLVHLCNDAGRWGAGFVLAVSRRWPLVEAQYRAWSRGTLDLPFMLGAVQFVPVGPAFWVANLVGQHSTRRQGSAPPIRYPAVREGLARVAEFAGTQGATVHMPRIGTGLAGGDWEQIERLIRETLIAQGIPVTVYDWPGPSVDR